MTSLAVLQRKKKRTDFDPTLEPFRIHAFGAGVQSKAMLMLYALEEPYKRRDGSTWRGFFPNGEPDLVIFADTQQEPAEVMEAVNEARMHLEAKGIRFEVVTAGDLGNPDRASTGTQGIFVPLFTVSTEPRWIKETTPVNPFDIPRWKELLEAKDLRGLTPFELRDLDAIPTQVIDVYIPPGEEGQLRRQCTGRYKIDPIMDLAYELAGDRPIEIFMGISIDEVERVKSAPNDRVRYVYPFIFNEPNPLDPDYYEYGMLAPMNRNDCVQFLEAIEVKPAKSACVFCPYRSEWAWAKMAAEDAESFERACEYDERMRHARPGYECYVHRSRTPLRTVQFAATARATLSLFSDTDMSQSGGCEEGYCGL